MKTIKRFIVGCGPIIGTTILFCIFMLILALTFIAINLVTLALYSFGISFVLFMNTTFAVDTIMPNL